MDNFHLPTSPNSDIQAFIGGSNSNGAHWHIWKKPRGKSMARITLIGSGGNGGTGVIGAVSTAGGGGGGGSGGMTTVLIPLDFLPDTLYISLSNPGVSSVSYVCIYPTTVANYCVAFAGNGGAGGNASGATGGNAGGAGSAGSAASMPLGWAFGFSVAGSAGIVGGTTGAGGALTLPLTGNLSVAGTGGAGLGASGSSGSAGGAYTIPAGNVFPSWAGGTGGTSATTPPGRGQDGMQDFLFGMTYAYGGTGGGSTHGSATGAGLVQAAGGNGINPGCGGGGSGGALTGSTAATRSEGGPGSCQIISF